MLIPCWFFHRAQRPPGMAGVPTPGAFTWAPGAAAAAPRPWSRPWARPAASRRTSGAPRASRPCSMACTLEIWVGICSRTERWFWERHMVHDYSSLDFCFLIFPLNLWLYIWDCWCFEIASAWDRDAFPKECGSFIKLHHRFGHKPTGGICPNVGTHLDEFHGVPCPIPRCNMLMSTHANHIPKTFKPHEIQPPKLTQLIDFAIEMPIWLWVGVFVGFTCESTNLKFFRTSTYTS